MKENKLFDDAVVRFTIELALHRQEEAMNVKSF